MTPQHNKKRTFNSVYIYHFDLTAAKLVMVSDISLYHNAFPRLNDYTRYYKNCSCIFLYIPFLNSSAADLLYAREKVYLQQATLKPSRYLKYIDIFLYLYKLGNKSRILWTVWSRSLWRKYGEFETSLHGFKLCWWRSLWKKLLFKMAQKPTELHLPFSN